MLTPNYLLFGFLFSLLSCLVLARLAPWLALMDRPDTRKRHGRAVPVVGGLGVMIAYVLVLKLRGIAGNLTEAVLPVGLMLLVGVIDDVRPVPARVKLLLQIVAAWMLLRTTGFVLASLPLPGSPEGLPLGPVGQVLAVVLIVAVLNAVNMADGADGLLGGYLVGGLSMLLGAAAYKGLYTSVLLIGGLIPVLLGFLACNARHPFLARAKVFMGDAGSLALAMVLCWLGLDMARGGHLVPPVLVLYAIALPLLDMVTVITRRSLQGASPMRADRTHLHHILTLKGWSVELSVPVLWALNAGIAWVGYGLWRLGAGEGTLLWLLLGALLAKMFLMRVWEEVEDPSAAPAEDEGRSS